MTAKSRILVVEDEPDALDLIALNLRNAGFKVIAATDGASALRKVRSEHPDLLILDLMLPEVDGLEVCKILRRDPDFARLPILMLTARAAEIDRVVGLELGADDYLTKPFSPREMVLRVRGLLRRRAEPDGGQDHYQCGALRIDLPRHRVEVQGKEITLTATEFKLLVLLAQRRGRVQSRDRLLSDVWDYESGVDSRTVDTHIRRLREKLGPAANYIETVRGWGYRFADDAPSS